MTRPSWALAVVLAALAFGVQAEGIRSPSMLANTCAGCHGTLGASAGEAMPTIGGLDKGYLAVVLDDYKTGLRPSTIMGRIMRGYSDQEIAAIASFYAEQPWVSTDRVAAAGPLQQGQEIHDTQCETCRAEGMRCTPRKMGERVMKLSDEELEALAQYYESQK